MKLCNISNGYAECDDGYVMTEDVPVGCDFDKDEIYYRERWFAYLWGKEAGQQRRCVGNTATGYASRAEAVEALKKGSIK